MTRTQTTLCEMQIRRARAATEQPRRVRDGPSVDALDAIVISKKNFTPPFIPAELACIDEPAISSIIGLPML